MKTNFLKTKKEIISWLDEYEIKHYKLIEDLTYGYTVNVDGNVNLSRLDFTIIPVKFNVVGRDFLCYYNQLTSLEFCPTNVGGDFICDNNQLTSLEFCPATVGGSFSCDNNQLTSLEFSPAAVAEDFFCNNNQLTSLEYCPHTVGGNFYCNNNQLVSLRFCPTIVDEDFFCQHNQLASLEFCPTTVGGIFICDGNPILKDVQKIHDFSEILNLHKETLIQIEQKNLEEQLAKMPTNHTVDKTTFKV